MNKRTPEVIIICGERDAIRYKLMLKLLLSAGAQSVAVFTEEDLGYFIETEKEFNDEVCRWSDIEGTVPIVLVHQGDSGYWTNRVQARSVFWFDTPGSPAGREGDKRIFRSTGAFSFDLTLEDAQEILQFGRGLQSASPSCCSPKSIPSYLPALAILCQGYLAVCAKERGSSISGDASRAVREMGWNPETHPAFVQATIESVLPAEWWLDALGLPVQAFPDQKPRVAPEFWAPFETALATEWGTAPLPSSLHALLSGLKACEPIVSPEVVAQAYLAIADHLGDARGKVRM